MYEWATSGTLAPAKELFQLYSNPNALQRTTFYFNGNVIPSPF